MVICELEFWQTEHHPHLVQTDLIRFCEETGIFYQAYSSLGTTTQDNQVSLPDGY